MRNTILAERRHFSYFVDPSIVGCWEQTTGNLPYKYIQIEQDGTLQVGGGWYDWRLTNSGQSLTWGASSFYRVSGISSDLFGIWRSASIDPGDFEEIYFRSDLSYSYHSYQYDSFGSMRLRNVVGDFGQLSTREWRGRVATVGQTLEFAEFVIGISSSLFSLNGDLLTIDSLTLGGVQSQVVLRSIPSDSI